VALVWNLEIDGGSRFFFDGTAYPVDLDLSLLDVTDDPLGVEIASSHAGPQYNSEHLWLALEAGREYLLRVVPGSSQGSFARDFAIAWLLRDPPPPDSDADGVADAFDNCTLSANPAQGDADADGFGNACDADLNNDDIVNFADLAIFKSAFGTSDSHADFDESGFVSFADLAILKSRFGAPPGPSGLNP
jgi:hypothetical protein